MKDAQMLQVKAYNDLKEMIIKGELEQGIVYSQKKIAESMGLSKTPLRDAILRLEQERCIDVYPSRGFVLHEMTKEDIEETYQMRSAIEGYCLKQFITNPRTERAREYIAKLYTKIGSQEEIIRTTGSDEEFARKDYEFHRSIVQFVGNNAMLEVYRDFMNRISRQNAMSFAREGRMQQTLLEHKELLEFLQNRQKDELEQLLDEHLRVAKLINFEIIETKKVKEKDYM